MTAKGIPAAQCERTRKPWIMARSSRDLSVSTSQPSSAATMAGRGARAALLLGMTGSAGFAVEGIWRRGGGRKRADAGNSALGVLPGGRQRVRRRAIHNPMVMAGENIVGGHA